MSRIPVNRLIAAMAKKRRPGGRRFIMKTMATKGLRVSSLSSDSALVCKGLRRALRCNRLGPW
jgi:hypothetical protein